MSTLQSILVAVVGLTPQVITETVYYLSQVRQPPVHLSAIHIVTTQQGEAQVRTQLLTPGTGYFYALCREYGLDAATIEVHINVLKDAAQIPLDDIRTAADNATVADQIAGLVRQLTSVPTTQIFCSLAGGRKTQSVLLGFALQLYGRPQDYLLHVLVDRAFENHPEFFYPPRTSRLLRTQDGQWHDAHTTRIDVAEIPYLRLRDKLFTAGTSVTMGFGQTIVQGQHLLDALPDLPPLIINGTARRLWIGEISLSLPPLPFVLYAYLAQLRQQCSSSQGGDGFMTLAQFAERRDELLQYHARLYQPYSGRVETLRRQWTRDFPRDSIRSHFARINRTLQQAVPDIIQCSYYQVSSDRSYGNTRYGIRLPPEKIEMLPGKR